MKKLLIICLVFCIAMIITAACARDLSNSGSGTWEYEKELTIHENSGKSLADYQVLVELSGSDFPTEAQSNGNDIRFTDIDGIELSYWIEKYDYSGKHAIIWMKVPYIPASGTVTIYLHYGNPSAEGVSNGDEVFEFFDDFLGESPDMDKWQINANDYSVLNSKLRINVGAISIADSLALNLNDGYVLEGKIMYHHINSGYSGSLSAQSSHYTLNHNDGADATNLYMRDWNSRDLLRLTASGSSINYNCGGTMNVFTSEDNVWYILGAKFHPGGVSLTENRTQEWVYNCKWVENINYISLGAFHGPESYDIQDTSYDWILIRKYISLEPTVSTPTSEISIPDIPIQTEIPITTPVQKQAGFEGIFAFIGLIAVVYLLRREK